MSYYLGDHVVEAKTLFISPYNSNILGESSRGFKDNFPKEVFSVSTIRKSLDGVEFIWNNLIHKNVIRNLFIFAVGAAISFIVKTWTTSCLFPVVSRGHRYHFSYFWCRYPEMICALSLVFHAGNLQFGLLSNSFAI